MDENINIGTGSNYNIIWDKKYPLLKKISLLIEQNKLTNSVIRKQDLQEVINPNFKHCLARMDGTITDVSELIEFFTFSDATIYHNRKMHASIHQNFKISKSKESEFMSYLESVYYALTIITKRQNG